MSSRAFVQDAVTNHTVVPFPIKMHEMLDAADVKGFASIVSWLPDEDNAFKVHDAEKFVNQIMHRFFKQTKYKSFQRQINIWGFERILNGPAARKGAYKHACFVRGQPSLCKGMKRQKLKGTIRKSAVGSPRTGNSLHPAVVIAPSSKHSVEPASSLSCPAVIDDQVFFTSAGGKNETDSLLVPQDGDIVAFADRQFYFVGGYNSIHHFRDEQRQEEPIQLFGEGEQPPLRNSPKWVLDAPRFLSINY
jgi:hypothetical protein